MTRVGAVRASVKCCRAGRCCQPLATAFAVTVTVAADPVPPSPRSPRRRDRTPKLPRPWTGFHPSRVMPIGERGVSMELAVDALAVA